MKKLVHNIFTEQFEQCNDILNEHIKNLIDEKLNRAMKYKLAMAKAAKKK